MNTKQLRQKILDLAIKGKLVPQDPNDEPASKLLERIREEKEQLIKDGKLKRDKNESHIFIGADKLHYEKFADGSVVCIEDEIPFEIPENWAWCRLKQICTYIQRGKSPKYTEEKKFPVISQKCIRWTGVDFKLMKYITEDSLKNYETVRFLCDNDILWNSTGTGTVGRAALYVSELNPFSTVVADSHVTVLRSLSVLSDYIHKYIMSPHVQIGFEDLCDGSTNQKELSLTTVCNFLIPIPPQSEQVRISSTVQELLEIIETIENDKIDLSELIKQTKAKVLDLAIKGKLVPQDLNDEPADKLLEKIREEKEKLIKEGKLKRDKNETIIFKNSDDNSYYEQIDGETVCIDDDLPFEIPNSWRWCNLCNISSTIPTKNYQILQSEILQTGKIPVVSQSSNLIEGYSFVHEKIYEHFKPVIVFGDHTRCVKYINFDFIVGADGVKIIADIKINEKYLFYVLEYIKNTIQNRGYSRHFQFIANSYIPIPSKNEQQRIANKIENIFLYLDNLELIIKGS